MSHQIETMAYTGKVPWHGIGTSVEGVMTAEEAIMASGLNWGVEKRKLFFSSGETIKEVKDKFAVVRTDKEVELGIVGNVYSPLQNPNAFRFFDAIVKEKMAIYHTAGSLKGGTRIWILAKLPNSIMVAGKDQVDMYTLLTNSHDGKGSVEIINTPIRVVCMNTLNQAREKAVDHFRIRHSGKIEESIADARKAIGVINRTADDFLLEANALVAKQMNSQMVERLLESINLSKLVDKTGKENDNRQDERLTVMTLMEKGAGNDAQGIKGSLWAGYNGITEYIDHVWNSRSQENRLERAWFGGGATLKRNALQTALEMAK